MMEWLDDVDFASDIFTCTKMGIKINEFKTKEMKVSPSTDLVLTINGSEVKEPFTYLGSIVSIDVGALEDVHSHIKKASGAFMELYTVWRNKIVRTSSSLIQMLSQAYCMGVKHGK